MQDAAQWTREYVGSSTNGEFRPNRRDRDGVNYKFIVIGKAVNGLGRDFHGQHPDTKA